MEDLIYGLILPIILVLLIIWIYILYVRMMIKLANRFGIKKNLWFLYIPFLQNYIIFQMADSKIWTFILSLIFFIPIVNILCYVMPVVWFWKIAKKLGYSGWWGIIFPLWMFVLEWETDDNEIKKEIKK